MLDTYNFDRLTRELNELLKRTFNDVVIENNSLKIQIHALEARLGTLEESPYIKAANLICSTVEHSTQHNS